jgi:hypothetical protein
VPKGLQARWSNAMEKVDVRMGYREAYRFVNYTRFP